MRVKTKADVMKRAHEITAPTFAEALAAAWAETREIEQEHKEAVEDAKAAIRELKPNRYATIRDLLEMVDYIISDNNFSSKPEKVHANLYQWRVSALEVIEVNTWTGGDYYSVVSVVSKKA